MDWPSKAADVLAEIDEYLDSNKLNTVGSGSILHQNVKKVLGELPKKEEIPETSEVPKTNTFPTIDRTLF